MDITEEEDLVEDENRGEESPAHLLKSFPPNPSNEKEVLFASSKPKSLAKCQGGWL